MKNGLGFSSFLLALTVVTGIYTPTSATAAPQIWPGDKCYIGYFYGQKPTSENDGAFSAYTFCILGDIFEGSRNKIAVWRMIEGGAHQFQFCQNSVRHVTKDDSTIRFEPNGRPPIEFQRGISSDELSGRVVFEGSGSRWPMRFSVGDENTEAHSRDMLFMAKRQDLCD